MKKLTIVKYGTAVLVRKDFLGDYCVDYNIIKDHGKIISKHNGPVLMVSSGAVGFGRSMANFDYVEDEVVKKRILASFGNPHLSMNWDKAIKNKNVLQALVTHRELQNDETRNDLKKIIGEVYKDETKAVIQFNENDFVSDAELKEIRKGDFGDNDKTTTLIAEICSGLFDEIELIINTSADGVLDESGKLIEKISAEELSDEKIQSLCGENKTGVGTGGMKNKLTVIRDLIKQNRKIKAYIINGKDVSQLDKILKGEKAGTELVCGE